MADQTAASLAATLLGLQRKRDPLDIYQSFGKQQLAAGSSTAPLGSGNPLEGIARALQGGIGGLMQGYGMAKEDQRNKDTVGALGDLYNAKDDAARAEIIKNYKGDSDILGPIAAQLLGQKQQRQALVEGANSFGGTPSVASPPQASGSPVSLDVPQGASPSVGAFANNSGNIRATSLPWEGKGTPQSGFETFATPQAGANAQFKNFAAYAQQNPNMTVAQALAKWAPPNENDTNGYVAKISEASGINPGMPLGEVLKDPAMAAQLLDAQTRLEKGGLPQGFNADTFMTAASGGQVGPGQIAQPPQQGGGDQPAQMSPMSPGPVAPNVPPMPDLSPTPQERATIQQRYASGAYGLTPQEAGPRAQTALDAMVKERIGLQESRTKMGYESQANDYHAVRDQQLKQPQDTIQNESKLREQFDQLQSVKDYRKAATVFRSAVDAAKTNTAAADLNMVYGFATLMDPGSVVRDSETGMVTATQNATDRVKALVASVSGGSRLSPESKAALVNEMGSRYESYKTAHDDMANTFKGIATRGQMNPDNAVVPYPPVDWKTKAAALPQPPPGFRPLP